MIEKSLRLVGRDVNAPWPLSNVWLRATVVNQTEADL
jgi:hypothetical protein